MARSGNKRIGILGGTFNPVHKGHLHVARHALEALNLNKVIFVPAYIPPHKKIRGTATATDRLKMLRLAIGSKKNFELSAYEIKKKGRSYSIKTARFMRKKYGKSAKLFFLIGADSLKELKKWKDIKSLFRILRFVVFPRAGFNAGKRAFPNILKVSAPKKEISSTGIRRFTKKGKPIKRFVPGGVYKYIKEKKLYR